MSPLVLGEILGLFVNTFTAKGICPVQDCEKLELPIQMRLSEKRKGFSDFLFHFWNPHQILNILEESMIVTANLFWKLQTVEIFLRPLSKKSCYITRFVSKDVKPSQILAKSP